MWLIEFSKLLSDNLLYFQFNVMFLLKLSLKYSSFCIVSFFWIDDVQLMWNDVVIIIIINSYTFVTSIKSTHEKLYAIYIEWAKLSEIENHSLSIQLLCAVKTIIMRLCIILVHVDCTLENEWLSHFKLLQKFRFHHHSCSCFEIFHDSNDYSIIQEVNIL